MPLLQKLRFGMLPTLDDLHLQCRIDTDEEDALLLMYLAAAKEKAENYLNRSLSDSEKNTQNATQLVITPLIKQALILAVGFWYDTRELKRIPPGFYEILNDYRIYPMRGKDVSRRT
ncbi:head-tail connector protein [Arsenophonus nasoniae]|nr:head-tail connector protein [Arsenophonus nasoniae]QBY44206.1 Phage gp6-like head-tail connector protein [Arsenophonus nasoniae]QBY44283.1 Phage gp6-like head-tail connector protein [Arsenophonus nasoniae]WGM00220.1 head-tail connector protein [Arsenophonus nasoniae]WGM00609.1 head-tail connector protein [Arsenophonus nasoniae]WGM02441.1 head-tail connector protein [Arsenophonus nasoniae]